MIVRAVTLAGAWLELLVPTTATAQARLGGREQLLRSTSTHWDSIVVPGARLYFSTASVPRRREQRIAMVATRAVRDVSRRWKIARAPVVSVFVVGSLDELPTNVGWRGRGWSSGRDTVVVVAANDTLEPPLTHEIAHVLTYQAWGRPVEPSAWIMEGVATETAKRCGAYGVRAIGRLLLETNRLPVMHRLITDFRTLPLGESYVGVATFVEYLEHKSGSSTPRRVWHAGADSLPVLTQRGWDRLDSEWREYLHRSPAIAPRHVLAILAGRGCT